MFPTPIRASATKEEYSTAYSTPLGQEDTHVRQMWKETDFVGAPIDLQLVARKHHDNQLFGAMRVLQEILKLP